MTRLIPKDTSADLVKLAVYAAGRAMSGKSFPCHPKRPGVPHVAAIAKAAGIADSILRSGSGAAQLAALVEGRLADAPAERRSAAAARIKATFRHRPLPRRGNSLHKEQIAFQAKITLQDVDTPECRAVVAALRKTNGMVRVPNDKAAERAAWQAFEAALRADGRGIPVNAANGKPAVTAIARAIGVPSGRFSHEPLRSALAAAVTRLGLADTDPIEAQAARLEAFVSAKVAAKAPAPRHREGFAFTRVGIELDIVAHRLRTNPRMVAAIARWIGACGFNS